MQPSSKSSTTRNTHRLCLVAQKIQEKETKFPNLQLTDTNIIIPFIVHNQTKRKNYITELSRVDPLSSPTESIKITKTQLLVPFQLFSSTFSPTKQKIKDGKRNKKREKGNKLREAYLEGPGSSVLRGA
jgi:hypothetical protein